MRAGLMDKKLDNNNDESVTRKKKKKKLRDIFSNVFL